MFKITDHFGSVRSVRDYRPHTGIDIALEEGSTLRSIVEGRVIQLYDGSGSLGKGVRIMAEDGKEFIYGHMNIVGVKVGDQLRFGDIIGQSGNTGNSTGPHLHFAVVENGDYVNPDPYIETLQQITGNNVFQNYNAANTIDEAMIPEGCAMEEKPSWWDVEGRFDYAFELKKCEIQQDMEAGFQAFLNYSTEVLVDFSYIVALFGGGILIILKAIGSTRASKYFWGIQLANVFIRGLLGGANTQ